MDGEEKKDSRKRRNTSGNSEAKGKAEVWDLEILEKNPIGINFNKPVVEDCVRNSTSDHLIGKPKIRPWLVGQERKR